MSVLFLNILIPKLDPLEIGFNTNDPISSNILKTDCSLILFILETKYFGVGIIVLSIAFLVRYLLKPFFDELKFE